MARDLSLLEPEFRSKCEAVLSECKERGYEMRPYFTVRSPQEQAVIWRRNHSGIEIRQAIEALRDAEALWLASVIESVGPQYGDPVRAALPGKSWHQFGFAMDCFWLRNGKAVWKDRTGYRLYHQVAKRHGLYVPWPKSDAPHIQFHKEKSPRSFFSWPEIDSIMKKKFG